MLATNKCSGIEVERFFVLMISNDGDRGAPAAEVSTQRRTSMRSEFGGGRDLRHSTSLAATGFHVPPQLQREPQT